ncbi:MAG: hypothetical protein QM627_14200 [Luteolibacter sp.]
MKLRQFVSVSSLVLAAWLGATFIQKVPAHRYPQLGKERSSTTATLPLADPTVASHLPGERTTEP